VTVGFTAFHRGGEGAPLVCLHGFTDTWRTWELVLPALERRHEVLALTLAGHAGGPALDGGAAHAALADAVERALDEAGFATVHLVGNSLGGFLALQLAERGRARSVVALAPAGGWRRGDDAERAVHAHFLTVQDALRTAVAHADAIVATPDGRRLATADRVVRFEHLPPELIAHQMRGAASCPAVFELIEAAKANGWNLDAERIGCPVRIVWGTEDRLLPWPASATRFREDWLPQADWVVLDDVGHCPQLDVPLETAQLILGFTV
jgi:pimeloyl-ACP methyl ester carboxylesterase